MTQFTLTPPDADSRGEKSVISETVAVINEQRSFLLPKDIRRILRQRAGVPKFSDNYFYTALKRASDNGFIAKHGDRYGPLDAKENPET